MFLDICFQPQKFIKLCFYKVYVVSIQNILRFAALTHDLGKVWSRKHHRKATIAVLKSTIPIHLHSQEIFKLIQRSHSHGNPKEMEWLVKGADRLASQIQRNVVDEAELRLVADSGIQRRLMAELKAHFAAHGLDVSKLRRFITFNEVLETVVSDEKDVNKTSLRKHLLLTEQVLNSLLELLTEEPLPKNLDGWIKTKKVHKYLAEHLQPIPPLETSIKPERKLVFNKPLRNFLEYAHKNGYPDDNIALQLGVTVEEVRSLKSRVIKSHTSHAHMAIMYAILYVR